MRLTHSDVHGEAAGSAEAEKGVVATASMRNGDSDKMVTAGSFDKGKEKEEDKVRQNDE